MPINFPNNPAVGDRFQGRRWDGAKWSWQRWFLDDAPSDNANWGRRAEPWNRVEPPIGTVMEWPTPTPPARWIVCGTWIERLRYTKLFAVIGTTYGTWTSPLSVEYFATPDFRGRIGVGADTNPGTGFANRMTIINSQQIGAMGGSQLLQAHTHGITDPGHGHGLEEPTHNHAVQDPWHTHGWPQNTHGHGVYDVGHGHTHHDPTHSHQYEYNGPGGNGLELAADTNGDMWFLTHASAVGMDVHGAGVGHTTAAEYAWYSMNPTSSGGYNSAANTGQWLYGNGCGIGIYNHGAGDTENVSPSLVIAKIIYAGE
jgi:microcystin-dependent protein